MLKDNQSGCKCISVYPKTTTVRTKLGFIYLCTAFGAPKTFMSDGAAHFKNKTPRLLSKARDVKHHLTLPCFPQTKDVVKLLSKKTFHVSWWIIFYYFNRRFRILSAVRNVIWQLPSQQLCSTAFTTFTAAEPTSSILTFICGNTNKLVESSYLQRKFASSIATLKRHSADLHPVAQLMVSNDHQHARTPMDRGELPKFSHNHFALVVRRDFNAGAKHSFRWRGPCHDNKATNDYACQIKYLCESSVKNITSLV